MKNEEYAFLRDEIILFYRNIASYNTVLYTASGAIFAFALGRPEYYYCLIPLMLTIPLYLLCETERRKACKVGAYLCVFHEGKDFNWERRHHEFDGTGFELRNSKGRDMAVNLSYIMPSVISCISAMIKIYFAKMSSLHYIIPSLALIGAIFVILKGRTEYIELRQAYIDEWERLKRREKKVERLIDNSVGKKSD